MKIERKFFEIPFDCMKDLIMEPCIKFNSEGLSINAFAESNAAMVIFNLPKEKFIQYEFEGEEIFKISSDLLSKIMKRIKTKNINLEFKDQRIILSDENKKEYAIAVMHDDEVERDIPVLGEEGLYVLERVGTYMTMVVDCPECRKCIKVCPNDAITIDEENRVMISTDLCEGSHCQKCIRACPPDKFNWENLEVFKPEKPE